MGLIRSALGLNKKKEQPKPEVTLPGEGSIKHKKTLRQRQSLELLEPYTIVETHEDGDVTVDSNGVHYVVCTDGRTFKEVKLVRTEYK